MREHARSMDQMKWAASMGWNTDIKIQLLCNPWVMAFFLSGDLAIITKRPYLAEVILRLRSWLHNTLNRAHFALHHWLRPDCLCVSPRNYPQGHSTTYIPKRSWVKIEFSHFVLKSQNTSLLPTTIRNNIDIYWHFKCQICQKIDVSMRAANDRISSIHSTVV